MLKSAKTFQVKSGGQYKHLLLAVDSDRNLRTFVHHTGYMSCAELLSNCALDVSHQALTELHTLFHLQEQHNSFVCIGLPPSSDTQRILHALGEMLQQNVVNFC